MLTEILGKSCVKMLTEMLAEMLAEILVETERITPTETVYNNTLE